MNSRWLAALVALIMILACVPVFAGADAAQPSGFDSLVWGRTRKAPLR